MKKSYLGLVLTIIASIVIFFSCVLNSKSLASDDNLYCTFVSGNNYISLKIYNKGSVEIIKELDANSKPTKYNLEPPIGDDYNWIDAGPFNEAGPASFPSPKPDRITELEISPDFFKNGCDGKALGVMFVTFTNWVYPESNYTDVLIDDSLGDLCAWTQTYTCIDDIEGSGYRGDVSDYYYIDYYIYDQEATDYFFPEVEEPKPEEPEEPEEICYKGCPYSQETRSGGKIDYYIEVCPESKTLKAGFVDESLSRYYDLDITKLFYNYFPIENGKVICPNVYSKLEPGSNVPIIYVRPDLADGYVEAEPKQREVYLDDPSLYNFCDREGTMKVLKVIYYFLTITKILVPVLIIIFGSIDFGKAMMSGKEEGLSVASKSFIVRILIGIVVFFIPQIIYLFVNLIDNFSRIEERHTSCYECTFKGVCEFEIPDYE